MKTSLGSIRKKLAGDSLSDHIVLLRLYQVRLKYQTINYEVNVQIKDTIWAFVFSVLQTYMANFTFTIMRFIE